VYKKILVPLENTPTDDTIVAHLCVLAPLHESALVLVHVADGFGARYQKGLNLADSEEMREDAAYLDRRRAELAAEGFEVDAVLEAGDPATKLVEVAEREGCDLIAMATHRHGPLQDLVRGSVAAAVRHKTQIPVLMVPCR
jgi:nucleotide-binding universal stress UspA family protein